MFFVAVLRLIESGVDPLALGLVETAAGAFGILGALVAPWLIERFATGRLTVLVAWSFVPLMVPLVFWNHPAVVALALSVGVFLNPAGNAGIGAYRVAVTPRELLGRSQATMSFVSMSVMPLAPVLAGVLLSTLGGCGRGGRAHRGLRARRAGAHPEPQRARGPPAGRVAGGAGAADAGPGRRGRLSPAGIRRDQQGSAQGRRQGRAPGVAQLGDRHLELALDRDHVAPGAPQGREGHAVALGQCDETLGVVVALGHRHDGACQRTRRRGRRTRRPPATSATETETPTPWRKEASASACARPPSDRSWALVTTAVARRLGQQRAQRLLGREVDLRRAAAEVAVHDVRPLRAGELVAGLAEQEDPLAGGTEAAGRPAADVVEHAEHADHRRRQDRRRRRSGCRS